MDKSNFRSNAYAGLDIDIGAGLNIFVFFMASLGYFVYDGLYGVFGILILNIILGIIVLVALVPVVGFIAQIGIMHYLAIPWIFTFTGLTETWLTTVIFWIFAIIGIVVTTITTTGILSKPRS